LHMHALCLEHNTKLCMAMHWSCFGDNQFFISHVSVLFIQKFYSAGRDERLKKNDPRSDDRRSASQKDLLKYQTEETLLKQDGKLSTAELHSTYFSGNVHTEYLVRDIMKPDGFCCTDNIPGNVGVRYKHALGEKIGEEAIFSNVLDGNHHLKTKASNGNVAADNTTGVNKSNRNAGVMCSPCFNEMHEIEER